MLAFISDYVMPDLHTNTKPQTNGVGELDGNTEILILFYSSFRAVNNGSTERYCCCVYFPTDEQVCEKDQRGLTGFSAAYAAASMCGVQPINQAEVYKLLVV